VIIDNFLVLGRLIGIFIEDALHLARRLEGLITDVVLDLELLLGRMIVHVQIGRRSTISRINVPRRVRFLLRPTED
jgi:hypothetical protein